MWIVAKYWQLRKFFLSRVLLRGERMFDCEVTERKHRTNVSFADVEWGKRLYTTYCRAVRSSAHDRAATPGLEIVIESLY
jgi:hypothetical protein